MRRIVLAALSAAALSGCASAPAHGPMGGPGGPDGPPGPRPGLFVSPFGEFFFSEPGQPWPVASWFAGADDDTDGRLTVEEFTADGQRWFRTLDLRADGVLRPEEIAAYEQTMAEARARMPGLDAPGMRGPGRRLEGFSGGATLNLAEPQQGPGRRERPRAPTGPLAYGPIAAAGFFNYPQPVKAADQDTNQVVTTQEWAAATDRWFIALDTDRDGVLTLATLPRTALQQLVER